MQFNMFFSLVRKILMEYNKINVSTYTVVKTEVSSILIKSYYILKYIINPFTALDVLLHSYIL